MVLVVVLWLLCVGVQRFVVPYIFNNVLECYQSTRIYSMVGKEYDCSLNKKSERKTGEKAARNRMTIMYAKARLLSARAEWQEKGF
jgi:rod shape determining protein RodA